MPYSSTSRLPASVRNTLPKHAQAIYRKAFENAWEEYKNPDKRRSRASREEAAHKVAWSAVKTKYKKNGEGKWSTRGDSTGATKSSRKSSAKSAKPASASARKSTRKSPTQKSANSARKTTAKSGAKPRQARWQTAGGQKKPAQKSRGKTATSRSTAGGRKSRKASPSATERRHVREESSSAILQPQEQSGIGQPIQNPIQPDAGQQAA